MFTLICIFSCFFYSCFWPTLTFCFVYLTFLKLSYSINLNQHPTIFTVYKLRSLRQDLGCMFYHIMAQKWSKITPEKKLIFVVVVNYPTVHSRGVIRGIVRAVTVGNLWKVTGNMQSMTHDTWQIFSCFLYPCFYQHLSRDSVSPVCGMFLSYTHMWYFLYMFPNCWFLSMKHL